MVTKEEVKEVVREIVGKETFKINRRLNVLEKKEEDRREREVKKNKGEKKQRKTEKHAGGRKGKKKGASKEFTEARRSIKLHPCAADEVQVKNFLE